MTCGRRSIPYARSQRGGACTGRAGEVNPDRHSRAFSAAVPIDRCPDALTLPCPGRRFRLGDYRSSLVLRNIDYIAVVSPIFHGGGYTPRNSIRRRANRIVGQVRVARGRRLLAVAKQCANHQQAISPGGTDSSETVTEVMKANIFQPGSHSDSIPRLRQTCVVAPGPFAGQDIWASFYAWQHCQEIQRWRSKRNDLCAGFAIG